MFSMKSKRLAGAAVATATLIGGGVAVVAGSSSADSVAVPRAADVAAKSPNIANANGKAGLKIDATKATKIDMSVAPAALQSEAFILTPSATGPCLLRPNADDHGGSSLSCGAGVAPTVAITPKGTIGVATGPDAAVELTGADSKSAKAALNANGVWFAPRGAKKAQITSDGKTSSVELDIDF